MKTITKMIMVSSLFSLSGMTNCVAAARWFSPSNWFSQREEDTSDGYPLNGEERACFLSAQELYECGEITRLEFAKSVVCIFQKFATTEKGLMDILCKQCGIPVNSEDYTEFVSLCLRNPSLEGVPILKVNIPTAFTDIVRASGDPCTNPLPGFCQAVMGANSLEEMAIIFDQFGNSDQFGSGLTNDPEAIAKQSWIYKKANVFLTDISRDGLEITIEEKKFFLSKNIFRRFSGGNITTQEAFQAVLDWLQKPEAEGGVGLDEADAFYVLKQIALAYRGQNGTADGAFLLGTSLRDASNGHLMVKFGGVKVRMVFKKINGRWTLVEKTECSPILGIQNCEKDQFVTSNLRFKFPGDSEIRTQLSVVSMRFPSGNRTGFRSFDDPGSGFFQLLIRVPSGNGWERVPLEGKRLFDALKQIKLESGSGLFIFDNSGSKPSSLEITEESMEWNSPFRENPPREVILYGGCQLPNAH
jgi:hypothetical protein